ncbi:MAG: peptidoglycan-binding protein, partial [bacterium]|nr:peptidoglycan-binding protein [bacterium]
MANDGKFEKGHLERKDKPSVKASFLFNPTEFTVEKGNQYAEVNIPGLPASLYQFVRGNSRSISMDLFFDT